MLPPHHWIPAISNTYLKQDHSIQSIPQLPRECFHPIDYNLWSVVVAKNWHTLVHEITRESFHCTIGSPAISNTYLNKDNSIQSIPRFPRGRFRPIHCFLWSVVVADNWQKLVHDITIEWFHPPLYPCNIKYSPNWSSDKAVNCPISVGMVPDKSLAAVDIVVRHKHTRFNQTQIILIGIIRFQHSRNSPNLKAVRRVSSPISVGIVPLTPPPLAVVL